MITEVQSQEAEQQEPPRSPRLQKITPYSESYRPELKNDGLFSTPRYRANLALERAEALLASAKAKVVNTISKTESLLTFIDGILNKSSSNHKDKTRISPVDFHKLNEEAITTQIMAIDSISSADAAERACFAAQKAYQELGSYLPMHRAQMPAEQFPLAARVLVEQVATEDYSTQKTPTKK